MSNRIFFVGPDGLCEVADKLDRDRSLVVDAGRISDLSSFLRWTDPVVSFPITGRKRMNMEKWAGSLSGYKTYIVAGTSILTTWAAFLIGEAVANQPPLTFADTVQVTVMSLLAVTFRQAMKSKA